MTPINHPRIINRGSNTIISSKATSQEVEEAAIITEVTIREGMAVEVETARQITTRQLEKYLLPSSLSKLKGRVSKFLKQHKFRIMAAKSRSQELLAEDRENLIRVELTSSNNTSQSFKLQIVKSKRLVNLHLTDKYIR
jgi:hypothetical protein